VNFLIGQKLLFTLFLVTLDQKFAKYQSKEYQKLLPSIGVALHKVG
jgi:hypothetical protein